MSNTNDLIRRGDAIDAVYSRIKQIGYENNVNVLSIRQAVREVPTAQPEIIRCKDCKHYDGRPCGIVDWYNTADDFCSRAERKDNVDNK